MKLRLFACAALLLGGVATGSAQVAYLDHQHMDFRILYDSSAAGTNQLDIQLRYNASSTVGPDYFYVSNSQAYIVGTNSARLTIPNNANYYFLGTPGAPVWVLPQSQNLSLPYLGTSAEDVPDDVFAGPITFELRSVEGPGNFFAWANSGANQQPIIKFICTNGVVSPDYNAMTPLIGSHEHYNWGFSTNGLYRITFRCTGQCIGETTNIVGKDVAWAFQILPLRPWETWVSTNWLPATATNFAGMDADPDGDGAKNIFEYAFGTDPNNGPATNQPAFKFVSSGGTNYGALVYNRNTNATDVTFSAVAVDSVVGSPWNLITNIVEVVSNGSLQKVTVRDDRAASATTNRFYKVNLQFNRY